MSWGTPLPPFVKVAQVNGHRRAQGLAPVTERDLA